MGNGHCKDYSLPGEYSSWVAIGVGVGGAVVGGISSNQQAKAANKPKTQKTDQTTTQNPWLSDWYTPDINSVLQYQRGVVARGVPQLGPNGQITYSNQLPWGYEGGDAQFAAGGGGSGGGGASPGPSPGSAVPAGGQRRPDGRILDAKGKTVYAPPAPAGGGKKGKGAGGAGSGVGATKAGPATVSPAINYKDPKDVFGAVAQRGLDAGNTATQQQARTATGNILGAAGGGGPERTGFEGYNPVLDRLTGRLEGNADKANARALLEEFIRGGGSGRGSSGAGANDRVNTGTVARAYTQGGDAAVSGGGPGSYGPGGAGSWGPNGGVPDTFAGDTDSYFEEQTRRIMDEQANEGELATLIASMNEDTEKSMYRDLAALDAASQGSGRFGGDMWKGMSRDAREEALQEMLKTSSGVRIGDRESRRQARLAALTGVNQRDLALLNANVNREQIAANERAAAHAASAAGAGSADAARIAERGQNLQAMMGLLGNEEFNLGQLGQVGGQLSSDRLSTLGMVPGLEGIGLQGLQTALGAGGGLTDLRGQSIQQNIANQGNALARQGMNQQAAMWNAGQQQQLVNNYLGTLMNIGSMGGTSRTVGTNVVPGAGISTSGSTAMGALGGGLAGYGAYQQYRQ